MMKALRIIFLQVLVIVQKSSSFSTTLPKPLNPQWRSLQRSSSDGGTRTSRPSLPGPIDTLTSGLSSILRLPNGKTVRKNLQPSPVKLLKFYNLENDAECRLVRECITELDLVVEEVVTSDEVPTLVLEGINGKQETIESATAIICRLEELFTLPLPPTDPQEDESFLAMFRSYTPPSWTSYLSSFLRSNRGNFVFAGALSTNPSLPAPLILYNYENNQFCRFVREVLTELGLPHTVRSVGVGSPRRDELAARREGGSTACPYLIDPNTGREMGESGDIVAYLYKTYATWTPPSETLRGVSDVVTPLLKPVYAALAPMQAGEAYSAAEETRRVEKEIVSAPVVVYSYDLSPFCTECKDLLNNLDVPFQEISLGYEWLPFLINRPETRAVLGEMTGQTSLPHVFVGGKSVGGLFSGTPGVVPALEQGIFMDMVDAARKGSADVPARGAETSGDQVLEQEK